MTHNDTIQQKTADFFKPYPARKYQRGEILIRGGSAPKGVFYITKGVVREYDISPSGDEIVVNVFKAPAFMPMSWAINQTPNRYYFEAFTEVEAQMAPAVEVVEWLRGNGDVAFDLLSRVFRGADGILERMVHLMENNARRRLFFELLISAARFGTINEKGECFIAMHESELAARVGLARETVSRELRAYKQKGLILVGQSGMTVTDLHALRTMLEADDLTAQM